MSESMRRRLEALETRPAAQCGPLLVVSWQGVEPMRLGPVGDRLPAVLREVDESCEAFLARAESLLRGAGPLVVFAVPRLGREPVDK